jgi:hypothetical protein
MVEAERKRGKNMEMSILRQTVSDSFYNAWVGKSFNLAQHDKTTDIAR